MADTDIKDPELENLDDIKEEETEELGSENEEDTPTEDKKETKEGDDEEKIDVDKLEIETRVRKEEKIEYGEDIDEEDVKTIGTIVEKQTASVKKALQEQQDRLEVDSFIAEKPEFAKYKPAILKYIQHPVYSQIPVKNIAAMVASNDLMKLGAKKEREAQAKADATKGGGTPVRKPSGSSVDWTKVSKDEFEAQKRKVLGQGL